MILALLRSMRPRQWTKNGVVFAGLMFAMRLGDLHDVLTVFAAFGVFCALSSSIYLVNDLLDVEADRAHPWKRNRPIASGLLPIGVAGIAALLLGAGSLLLAWCLGLSFFYTLLAYALLMVAYSLVLKRIAMVDVLIIAIGFVLRAAAGAAVIDVLISPWLFLCTLLLAVLLALAKRRQEVVGAEAGGGKVRRGWVAYSTGFLDQMIAAVAAATIVCYSLYTLATETVEKFQTTTLIYTIPFVIYGVFRYVYLVRDRGQGERPERVLLTDVPLMMSIILWGVVAVAGIYGVLPEPPIEHSRMVRY